MCLCLETLMNINKESRDTKKIGQTPFSSPTSTFPSAATVPFMLLTFLSHLRYRAWAANTSSESVLAYEPSAQGKCRTALADMLAASTAAGHLSQPLPGFCLMHAWASPVTELLIRSGPHSLVIRNPFLFGVCFTYESTNWWTVWEKFLKGLHSREKDVGEKKK